MWLVNRLRDELCPEKPWSEITAEAEADSFDGIVNTTPVGMFPEMDETPVDLDQFQNLSFVIDVIANPLRTKLLFEGKCRGIRTLGGFEMLVRQAYAADLIFTGKDLPSESADECLAEIYRKKRNIVLIGMPTSGKTTMSALVGEKIGRPVIEMDDEIVRKIGTGIKECFAEKGEAYFRQKETEVARDFREGKGLVISCGGGVIKTPETMRYLSENGLIIWIKRNVDQLYPTDSRPLSSTDDALHKLYEERLPLYRMYADMVADNTGTIEETVNSILKMTGDRK
jgi:shikimate dehydrogenase